jgi:hypothetical protein
VGFGGLWEREALRLERCANRAGEFVEPWHARCGTDPNDARLPAVRKRSDDIELQQKRADRGDRRTHGVLDDWDALGLNPAEEREREMVVLGPDPARGDAGAAEPFGLRGADIARIFVERDGDEKAFRTLRAVGYFAPAKVERIMRSRMNSGSRPITSWTRASVPTR